MGQPTLPIIRILYIRSAPQITLLVLSVIDGPVHFAMKDG